MNDGVVCVVEDLVAVPDSSRLNLYWSRTLRVAYVLWLVSVGVRPPLIWLSGWHGTPLIRQLSLLEPSKTVSWMRSCREISSPILVGTDFPAGCRLDLCPWGSLPPLRLPFGIVGASSPSIYCAGWNCGRATVSVILAGDYLWNASSSCCWSFGMMTVCNGSPEFWLLQQILCHVETLPNRSHPGWLLRPWFGWILSLVPGGLVCKCRGRSDTSLSSRPALCLCGYARASSSPDLQRFLRIEGSCRGPGICSSGDSFPAPACSWGICYPKYLECGPFGIL